MPAEILRSWLQAYPLFAAVTLCDALDPDGASWGDDGNIVAALNGKGSGLWRVPSSGGTPFRQRG